MSLPFPLDLVTLRRVVPLFVGDLSIRGVDAPRRAPGLALVGDLVVDDGSLGRVLGVSHGPGFTHQSCHPVRRLTNARGPRRSGSRTDSRRRRPCVRCGRGLVFVVAVRATNRVGERRLLLLQLLLLLQRLLLL